MNHVGGGPSEAIRLSGFRPPLFNIIEERTPDGEVFRSEASPGVIQVDGYFLGGIEAVPKFLPLPGKALTATLGSGNPAPRNAVKPVEDRTQFPMAELEWRGGEEEHSFKYTRQRPPRDFIGVSLGILGSKQGGQPSVDVLEVVGFVEN
jgi:hypothetical protein